MGAKMSSMSSASSDDDPPVVVDDLEKGVKKAAATEEELNPHVHPLVPMCLMFLLDAYATLCVLIFIALFAWMVSVSNNWWDPWPAVVILLPILVFALWAKTKTNYGLCMKKLASRSKDNDLSNKLLSSENNE